MRGHILYCGGNEILPSPPSVFAAGNECFPLDRVAPKRELGRQQVRFSGDLHRAKWRDVVIALQRVVAPGLRSSGAYRLAQLPKVLEEALVNGPQRRSV